MKRISAENQSPLIMECPSCKHREYAEIQISTPWLPAENDRAFDPSGGYRPRSGVITEDKGKSAVDPSGMPVSVGNPDKWGKVIPFGWIIIGFILALMTVVFLLWLV